MLVENILEQVQRDIASFADPGTGVEISDRSITWTRSRARISAKLIRRPTGFPDVSYGGREYSYTSFLASEVLADLKDLAETIFATMVLPTHYVPMYARTSARDGRTAPRSVASELILDQTVKSGSLPLAATRVLFVHGNAGTGKTSTLRQVTRLQAERYLRGESSTLLLYLDAQGKGLAQLEDVMARALQDLRAKFTYHSVAALTRRLCVIPIIDGFDELIGPSSAREAFSNLSQFLAQLDCEGALITSSRTAFIDYRALHERAAELAASQNLSYEIVPLEILEWDDTAIEEFCGARTPGSSKLKDQVFDLMKSEAGELVRKPFFLAKICDILFEGRDIDVSTDIPRQVVDFVLAREASKLKDARGKELLTTEQHRTFCALIADEMWSFGVPELDCDTIRLLAELVAEQFKLDPRDTKILVDRSVSHGLLSVVPGRIPEKRAFEHELFRFEFQAGSLAKLLDSGSEAGRDYLRRGELPLEIVARIPLYGLSQPGAVSKVLSNLNGLVASAPNNQFAATNAGSVAWALLRDQRELPSGLKLFGFYLRSHDLGRCQLEHAEITRCVFEKVDLSRMKVLGCVIEETQFIGCTLGAETRWTGTRVRLDMFSGVRVQKAAAGIQEVYDPAEIRVLLKNEDADLAEEGIQAERETLSERGKARAGVIERLLTHARNHFYLSRSDPWFQNNLASSRAWSEVEPLLRKHRLLENVSLAKSGRPETFLRLATAPDKILQARSGPREGIPTSAVEFWLELLEV